MANEPHKNDLEIVPNDAGLHNNIGIIQQELGKFNASELSLRKALELNNNYPEAQYNLGNTLHKLGRKNEAEKCYYKAVRKAL